jgi:hypothetical protein
MLVGRPIAPELLSPWLYAFEYYKSQASELRKHGFPPQSAHMKFAPGSTAPTPDDPKVDKVGLYFAQIMPHERRLMDLEFDFSLTPYTRARKIGVTERRYNKDRHDILLGLKGFLSAF